MEGGTINREGRVWAPREDKRVIFVGSTWKTQEGHSLLGFGKRGPNPIRNWQEDLGPGLGTVKITRRRGD